MTQWAEECGTGHHAQKGSNAEESNHFTMSSCSTSAIQKGIFSVNGRNLKSHCQSFSLKERKKKKKKFNLSGTKEPAKLCAVADD